jgi:hypothetical protein
MTFNVPTVPIPPGAIVPPGPTVTSPFRVPVPVRVAEPNPAAPTRIDPAVRLCGPTSTNPCWRSRTEPEKVPPTSPARTT